MKKIVLKKIVLLAAVTLVVTLAACTQSSPPSAQSTSTPSAQSTPSTSGTTSPPAQLVFPSESNIDAFVPPGPTPPASLIARQNWLHQMWNARKLSAITPYLAPVLAYKDHATQTEVALPSEWTTYAGGIFSASSDAQMQNRVYYQSGNVTICKFTLRGTNDKSYEGHAATGKKFAVDGSEFLTWSTNGTVTGGDLYYDRLYLLLQLGLIKPPTPTPATTATPAPTPTPAPPSGLSTTPPRTLIEEDKWGHDWWNAKDLRPFLVLFEPVIYYVEHSNGHVVTSVPEMNEFASKFWAITSDVKMINRVYIQSGNMVVCKFTIVGTQDRPVNGKPPTNKKFMVDAAEFIYGTSEGKGVGGDMYYDVLTAADEMGFLPPGVAIG